MKMTAIERFTLFGDPACHLPREYVVLQYAFQFSPDAIQAHPPVSRFHTLTAWQETDRLCTSH